MTHQTPAFVCFAGHTLLAEGEAPHVAAVAAAAEPAAAGPLLIFETRTGRQLELDHRSRPPALAGALEPAEDEDPSPAAPAGRGRPRLGVVAREVTLLPRHWRWLEGQPGGASAALRRLVDQARRDGAEADRARQAQQAAWRVMTALAGDLPGFEEATRALFAPDSARFADLVRAWPQDVADYVGRLAAPAWP